MQGLRRLRTIASGLAAPLLLTGVLVPIAGVLLPASPASAAAGGTLEICKRGGPGVPNHKFWFGVDTPGKAPIAVRGGHCSTPMNVSAGDHTVVEIPSHNPGFEMVSADVIGAGDSLKSSDPATGTAVVTVGAGSTAVVTFHNQQAGGNTGSVKVCKTTSSPSLLSQSFSFTATGVAGAFPVTAFSPGDPNQECSALHTYKAGSQVTVTEGNLPNAAYSIQGITVNGTPVPIVANGTTVTIGNGTTIDVNFDNESPQPTQTGIIEVCKNAGDRFVSGVFTFNVSPVSPGVASQYPVRVGQCSPRITVPGDTNITVSEVQHPNQFVSDIDTSPHGRWVDKNLTNGTVTVVTPVSTTDETLVDFTNSSLTGQLKVCKTVDATLAGGTFYFSIRSAGYTSQTSVVTGPGAGTFCTLVSDDLPVGSTATVTEDNSNTNIAVSGSPGTVIIGQGINTVTISNSALGFIEICKDPNDLQTSTQTFTFMVDNGGPGLTQNIHANTCGAPIQVPVGTHTVTEVPNPNFHLIAVEAFGSGGLSDNELVGVSGLTATVNVDYAGVSPAINETQVRFLNGVDEGDFKICKVVNDKVLDSVVFHFEWSYTVDGARYSGTTDVQDTQYPFPTCSGTIGDSDIFHTPGIPVVDSKGNPVSVTVTEVGNPSDVTNLSILYQGNGSDVNNAPPSDTFYLGLGTNVVTYTNGFLQPPGQ